MPEQTNPQRKKSRLVVAYGWCRKWEGEEMTVRNREWLLWGFIWGFENVLKLGWCLHNSVNTPKNYWNVYFNGWFYGVKYIAISCLKKKTKQNLTPNPELPKFQAVTTFVFAINYHPYYYSYNIFP